MTPEARIDAVAAFGFTPRQARFLVTVTLHGGYCLRRQYEAFAGIRYGKNVRAFLDRLVAIGLADRFRIRADRGHVYHIHGRSLYNALGQEDNRNRRPASPAQIARKLMLLDIVIGRPDVSWYATEQDKVDLFVRQFHVPLDVLPRRMADHDVTGDSRTARYFVEKRPIYVTGEPPVPHFVYLATDGSRDGFVAFLRDHVRLFEQLPRWTVVVVGPSRWTSLAAVFEHWVASSSTAASALSQDLRWYFERRSIVEQGNLAQVPVSDLRRFRQLQQQLSTHDHESRYTTWLASHGVAGASASPVRSVGSVLVEALPFAYQQFGSLPGVA